IFGPAEEYVVAVKQRPSIVQEVHQAPPSWRRRPTVIRAIALAIGVMAAAAALPAWAQKSPTAKAALNRAVAELGANHFAQAAAEMETAVRFEPRFASRRL